MRGLRLAVLCVAGLLFHWWWERFLPLWGLAPDWLLVATVALAGLYGPVLGQALGFLWGLGLGVLSARLFGAQSLLLVVVGYGVGSARRQMDLSAPSSQMIVAGLVSAGYALAYGLLGRLFGGQFLWVGWKIFLLGSLYNALVSPLVFAAVEGFLD